MLSFASVMSDSATPWTVACQALCPWDFSGKNTEVGCHALLQESFQTRDWTYISCIGRQIPYHWATCISFAAQQGDALYSQQKQEWKLTLAQIMNFLLQNSDLNWRK